MPNHQGEDAYQDQKGLPVNGTPTYARTLRAIGHALESLHVEAFDLESNGKGYHVRGEAKAHLLENSPLQNLLKSGLRAVWRTLQGPYQPPPSPVALELHYSPEDIERLDSEGRERRSDPKGMPDTFRLSQALRLVGAYIDLKGARLLGLSMRDQWITLRYETAQALRRVEEHRIASLQDLSVNRYLHRSNRNP